MLSDNVLNYICSNKQLNRPGKEPKMNQNQEYFKQNTQRNGKSRNQYWYSADPIDTKADKSSRAMHRARLAQLLEDGAFEVTV